MHTLRYLYRYSFTDTRRRIVRRAGWSALAVTLVLAIEGCMSLTEIAPPVEGLDGASSTDRGMDIAMLGRGRDHYLRQCGACHALEPIGKYSEAGWRLILPDMIERSNLRGAKAEELTAYVMTVRRHLDRSAGD